MSKDVNVGIVGTGIYLPKNVKTAKDISILTNGFWTEDAVKEKLGINQIFVPDKNIGPQEMSYLAAIECLKNTGVDPLEIDVVMSITEEWKEYPLTTSALYVQGKLGAVNAWGIDVQNRCSTSVSAIKMAKDMLVSDDEIHTILIVGGYQNGDFIDFTDKDMSMMYNLSAGAGALIMKKNHNKNLVLGSHIIGDGTLARSAGVMIGGTANPINDENMDEAYHSLRLFEPQKMKDRLKEVSNINWFKCIDESLRKSKLTRKDIDYLAILHIKRSGHNQIVEELGLKDNQTIYLEDYGHIGQVDQILSIHLANERKILKKGDNVVLLAAGIGYVWASSIVRWG